MVTIIDGCIEVQRCVAMGRAIVLVRMRTWGEWIILLDTLRPELVGRRLWIIEGVALSHEGE